MQSSLSAPGAILLSFLLALGRVSGVVAFLPMPGLRNAPDMTRIALALSLTFCLSPFWPPPPSTVPGIVTLLLWVLSEAAFGVLLGLFISVLVESFQLGAQLLGLQAGFSYASTVDPTSQADSSVLQVLSQLLGATLFFSLGLHRQVVALLAKSLQTVPPGSFVPSRAAADSIINFSGTMFSTGLRIAFPVLALLLLVDLSLALLSRIQAQLQLLTLAFPAKMLAGIGFFAATLWVTPAVAESSFRRVVEALTRLLDH